MPPGPNLPFLVHTPRRIILIRRPRMQHMRIRQELSIPNIQNHMQSQPHARVFQHLRRLFLLLRQSRNDTFIRKPRQTLDVVWIPFTIHPTITPRFFVKDRLAGIWFLAVGDFTFAVKVPVGRCEGFDNIGAFAL